MPVPRWILRFGPYVIDLEEGSHVLGRSQDVEVPVDDELVSRRHAEIVVTEGGAAIRDLGSRNGVLLGPRRLPAGELVPLAHGDTFVVGATRCIFARRRGRSERVLKTVRASMVSGPSSGASLDSPTGAHVTHLTFLAEADRSLAQGRLDRFATATHLLLENLSTAGVNGLAHEDPAVSAAARHALQLAEMRGVEWVELLLDLYTPPGYVLSAQAVATLHRLFEEHDWRSTKLDAYVARVRPRLETDPRGRALLMQLEALQRRQQTRSGSV
jgi:predicted component of type VI protein secretion system